MRFSVGPAGRPGSRRRLVTESLERRDLLTTLQVTEINYNPYEPLPEYGELSDNADDFAFIELGNVGSAAINLQGMRLARINDEGVDFTFGNMTLEPDERIVVVEDVAVFESRYGTDVNLVGAYSGGLSKNKEMITLLAADDSILQQFEYDSDGAWPSRADGRGSTLELKDVTGDPDKASTWRSSKVFGGTPGVAPPPDFNIIINEVLAHTDAPQVDTIEVYNPTDTTVDLSNWYLSDFDLGAFDPGDEMETDSLSELLKFQIPEGTEIAGNGYVVFSETDFNPGQGANESDFALSEFGDNIWLTAGDGGVRPTHFVDNVSFGPNLNGVSLGLLPNGNTKSDLLPLSALSLGSENESHWKSPVVIEEIHYHPSGNDESLEFIELRNASSQPLVLDDWRIEDAVDVVVPAGTTLGRNQRIVLVSFDPADDTASATFRDAHGIDNSVQLLGPWGADTDGVSKRLSNGGEKVTLKGPTTDLLGTFHYIADQVDYDNGNPWPIASDGFGGSLQRANPEAFGNDPTSWLSATPSPGSEMQTRFSLHNEAEPLDVDGSGQIVAFDVLQIFNHLNGVNVTLRPIYLDVDDDGTISPFDALQVINHLNQPTAARPAATDPNLVAAALAVDDEPMSGKTSDSKMVDDVISVHPKARPKHSYGWIGQVESLFKS